MPPPPDPTSTADRRPDDDVLSPVIAGILMFCVLAACSAALWRWASLPVAAALGVGFMEGGPLRRRLGLRVAVAATAAAAVVLVVVGTVGETPLRYAVAAGAVAAAAGLSARWGLYQAAVFTPLAVVILSSPVDHGSELPRAAALLVGALLGAVLLGVLRLDRPATAAVVAMPQALMTAAFLGLSVGGSLYVAERAGAFQGHWVALSILSVAVPSAGMSQERSLRRTAATVGGAVVAAAVTAVLPAGVAVLALGLVAAVVSLLVRSDGRRIAALTVGVVLFAGGGSISLDTALARVAATAIGAVVVVGATLLVGRAASTERRAAT